MIVLNKKLYGSPRNAPASKALLKKALGFTIGASLLAGSYGDRPLKLKGREMKSDETKLENLVDLENMDGEIPHIINPDMEVLPEGARPYLVSLRQPDPTNTIPHKCGGSLISSRVVLTAAHCVVDELGNWSPPSAIDFNRYFRRNGTNNPNLITYRLCAGQDGAGCAPDEAYAVASPFYDPTSVPIYDHDWALIILPASAPMNDIVPVPLNTDNNIPDAGEPVEVFGWGHTSSFPDPVTRPDTPMTVTLRYVQQSLCQFIHQARGGTIVTDNMLCLYDDERASCQGDSGGPSVIDYADGSTEQVGVVSWGPRGCALDGVPNVMVRVSEVYPWIASFACARTGEFCPTPAPTPKPTSAKSSKGPPPTMSPSASPSVSPTPAGKANKAAIVEGGSAGYMSMSMSMSMDVNDNEIEFGKKRRRHLANGKKIRRHSE